MPVVMVDIGPPEPPAALARALFDACSAAVRVGSCLPATGAEAIPAGTLVATVRWDPADGLLVEIEVKARTEEPSPRRLRRLEFGVADPVVERWRSAGLTVATLAGEITRVGGNRPPEAPGGSRASSSPPAVRTVAGRDARAPDGRVRQELTRETLWITLEGLGGPGLVDGGWRGGAWADVGWRPTRFPFFTRLSVGFAVRPADARGLSVQWETVTLGLGGVAGEGRFTLQPRLSASFDSVRAGVTEPSTGRRDSGASGAVGLHAGADVVFQFVRYAGLVASLDAWHLDAPTNIVLENQRVGVSAANGWALGLGVRFFLQ